MQTLRKKTSPLKYKNETSRFLGDGVSFKAKLIGILEVSEARGDRMCQEALCDLKMAIRAAGEHKQRITVNIAIDGLRLRDEKTGDCLYHHPVHKISFIAQDMTDSRAFGYIFGSPDTGHRFFGIKTDKAASQVVIAMRDLFQVVFALKKKEIELAKQHLEKSYLTNSPMFSDSPNSVSKPSEKSKVEPKGSASTAGNKSGGTAVADLVDLELELNSLQQGLNQMERITPSDPFASKDDPFGDSFISYPINKLILPPPPSSGRERTSRTSEGCSTMSTKTPPNTAASVDSVSDSILSSSKTNKEFSFSRDFNSSHEEPSSGDWFNQSSFGTNSIFEEPTPLVPTEPPPPTVKDEKHEATKQEIMSQFDVFTELDPLGTGRSKPYIDKKHFFQELKNPPKKALNELASNHNNTAPAAAQDLFNINFTQPSTTTTTTTKSQQTIYSNTTNVFAADPFGDDPFKEDPFADSDFSKQDPFETELATQQASKELHAMIQNNKSPGLCCSSSPKTVQFSKFEAHFDSFGARQGQSQEMSSESECAPEPPPRPAATLGEIQPPPLPPKKQSDIILKPPPRPPHTEDNRYDYIENFEHKRVSMERSPPLPVPQRKSKFESDFTTPPERPRKSNQQHSSDEDYLTPVNFPLEPSDTPGVLLPPPQRHMKKEHVVTVASLLESKPTTTTSIATDSLNNSLEGLDMTLSQLTLSGLNELAAKLKIPPHKLSNMTLVQLTNYLSTFIKSQSSLQKADNEQFPTFQADFAANFNNMSNNSSTVGGSISTTTIDPAYDRYAVFRELQEEIKQTKIDTEPEEIQLEEKGEQTMQPPNEETGTTKPEDSDDKYAAIREIVNMEIIPTNNDENHNNNQKEDEEKVVYTETQERILEYYAENMLGKDTEAVAEAEGAVTMEKSPAARSPAAKSPVPNAVTQLIQSNARTNSGSLSDVLSGSSPEVDNTGSNSDIAKKNLDPAGESWAIFDQPSVPSETKENENLGAAQSEEGVSPWSSDSKEFVNRSPTEWKKEPKVSERRRKIRGNQEGWWDTSADPEGPYYPANRRSTDSFEEEYYECYDRPRRRRQGGWQQQTTGGHSSSSRDVSPWEEEPRRRDGRTGLCRHSRGHSFDRHRDVKQHVDSWDEEDDDYEYDEEHRSNRGHYFQRHGSKDSDRHSSTGSRDLDSERWEDYGPERRYRRRREGARDSKESKERWCCPDWEQGEHDKTGRYVPRRPNLPDRRDRYDERYRSSRESQDSPWEDEYSNDLDDVHSPHYVASTTKKNWKQRPSSASEMERKTGELKTRHYLGTGGSDGENRRYKSARRSRSRESQFSEPSHRHKSESSSASRGQHRSKLHKQPVESDYLEIPSKKLSSDSEPVNIKKLAGNRKKLPKESSGSVKGEPTMVNTFPRKGRKSQFDIDFVPSDESPIIRDTGGNKFNFENDFDKRDSESPVVINRSLKGLRQQSICDKTQLRLEKSFKERRSESFQETKHSPRYQVPPKPRSPFEDDFSPSEKTEPPPPATIGPPLPSEGNGLISSIKEEPDLAEEDEDSFGATGLNIAANGRKKILNKNRLSTGRTDVNLKKSGSVNIFSRENDPFDDDFFCGTGGSTNGQQEGPPRSTELRWTEEFEDSDCGRK